jgi:hypothetical protein
MRYRKVCGFESHLGHSVSAGQRLFVFLLLTKLDFLKFAGVIFLLLAA